MKVEKQVGPIGLSVEFPDDFPQEVVATMRLGLTFHANELSEQEIRRAVTALGGPGALDSINASSTHPHVTLGEDPGARREGEGSVSLIMFIPDGRESVQASPFAAALANEQSEARLATEGGAP